MKKLLSLAAFAAVVFIGCSKEDAAPNDPNAVVSAPVIVSLTTDRNQIMYGGEDPAVITCEATGGNLTYKWEVDLGDIIPLNADRSKVRFTGSACCVGKKVITCTVSNSLGSVSKTVEVIILEEVKLPEILDIDVDKSTISVAAGGQAKLRCFALGGELQYTWEINCGEVVPKSGDSSQAVLNATQPCVGTRTVTCIVANRLGSASKSVQITIAP